MKNSNMQSNLIYSLAIFCILLLFFQTKAMDIKPQTQDQTMIIQGADGSMKVPKSVLLQSKTLSNLLSDLANEQINLSLPLPEIPIPLNFSIETISSIFKILSMYTQNPRTLLYENIKSLPHNILIDGIKLIDYLDLPEDIASQFLDCLKQLSPRDIIQFEGSINSLSQLALITTKMLSQLKDNTFACLRTKTMEQFGTKIWKKSSIQNNDLDPESGIYALALSHDGKLLAIAQLNRTVILNLTNNTTIAILIPQSQQSSLAYSLEFSNDGKQLIAGYLKKDFDNIILWDIETQKEVHVFRGHPGVIGSIKCIPQSNLFVSGSENAGDNLAIWDLASQQKVTNLQNQFYSISSLAVSPDAKLIACASDIATNVYNAETFRIIANFTSGNPVAFSSTNDKLLIGKSSPKDKRLYLYNIKNSYPSDNINSYNPHLDTTFAQFSPDTYLLLSVSTPDYKNSREAFLWSSITGTKICSFLIQSPTFFKATGLFSADGNSIIAISPEDEKSLVIWTMLDKNRQEKMLYYANKCTLSQMLTIRQLCLQKEGIRTNDTEILMKLPSGIMKILQQKQ